MSSKARYQALLAHGYDVTRTPNEWMPRNADNAAQLLGATAHGRIIFTYHIRDFTELDQKYTAHAGIVLAAQRSWRLAAPITALVQRFVSPYQVKLPVDGTDMVNRVAVQIASDAG